MRKVCNEQEKKKEKKYNFRIVYTSIFTSSYFDKAINGVFDKYIKTRRFFV